MNSNWLKKLVVACAVVPVGTALSQEARALTLFLPSVDANGNPTYGNTAILAGFSDGQWIAVFPAMNPDCAHVNWLWIGPPSGLQEPVTVYGSIYSDVIIENANYAPICGFSAWPVVHNGYRMALHGERGDDFVQGLALTDLWGYYGGDVLCSCGADSGNSVYGGEQVNCLVDRDGTAYNFVGGPYAEYPTPANARYVDYPNLPVGTCGCYPPC
jgi:hypothetical protein